MSEGSIGWQIASAITMLGAGAGIAYAVVKMNGKLKNEQEQKLGLERQVSELSDKLNESERSLSIETYDRLRILREKRSQQEEMGFKKQNQIRKIEQEFKQALQVEISKRQSLSIEAKVMFADVKKM